jgi:hypothetical protein
VFNQFEKRWGWWEVVKILQYSEMECSCVRKIAEGLYREYVNSALWQHKYESPMPVLKVV